MVLLEERVAETSQWRRAIKGMSELFDNSAGTTHTCKAVQKHSRFCKHIHILCVFILVFHFNYLLSKCVHSDLVIFILVI